VNETTQRAAEAIHRTILVPLDGSRRAERALPVAQALAARFDATVHSVSVVGSDAELQGGRASAALALGTRSDDPRIHVCVGTDVAGAVYRCALGLESCLICLSIQGRGTAAGSVIGSTAREIIERSDEPVVVVGPSVVDGCPDDATGVRPLGVDHLVVCVDGTPASELGLAVAAAWADALGLKLTFVTVAEPCPPPVRIGVPWRRQYGPDEDADEYVRRLGERWALDAPGLETAAVYHPISAAAGIEDYLAAHPAGLIAVTSHLRTGFPRTMLGTNAAEIVHTSTAPALVITASEQPAPQPTEGIQ
jgi:nucleotide-binding universal stress UspA family protein